ncbi:MAG: polyhydroxybutyrate depolymerase [Chitinophagales bacterium]|jgi:polyhydroxybutyrate depolymerase
MFQKLAYFLFLIVLSFQLNAQTFTDSFQHDTSIREYTVHVPAAYNAASSVPLLISLHGLGDNMANFSGAGFHALSESENFIVVTPQALNFSFLGFAIGASWNSGVGAEVSVLSEAIYPNEYIDDVGFISALIDSLSSQYNIDPDRIYATGFSMGGFMSNRLAVELNDRIAAIASVSGTLGDNVSRNNNPCPIPAMHIHGTADATIDYHADYSTAGGLYVIVGDSVSGLMNFWNGVNQTDATPLHNPNYASVGGMLVEEFIWENGVDNSVVRHLKINGGDHVWFSGLYPSEIWDFLSVHENKDICLPNAIKDRNTSENFTVYPNPSNNKIQVIAESEIQELLLYNALGEKVMESTQSELDISKLSKGVYYLFIQTTESRLTTKVTKK